MRQTRKCVPNQSQARTFMTIDERSYKPGYVTDPIHTGSSVHCRLRGQPFIYSGRRRPADASLRNAGSLSSLPPGNGRAILRYRYT